MFYCSAEFNSLMLDLFVHLLMEIQLLLDTLLPEIKISEISKIQFIIHFISMIKYNMLNWPSSIFFMVIKNVCLSAL